MVCILGVHFTDMTEDEVFGRCSEYMRGDRPRVVVTAGPEFVMSLRRRPDLRYLTEEADMTTPDGIGIVIASRWYGRPLRERVTGVELAGRLLACAADAGFRAYLLGAAPASLEMALANLRSRYPRLQLEGSHGYFAPEEEADIVAGIRAFAPHLLLVGLGQPRQDIFIARHRDELRVPLALGVGGTIDVLAGTVRRAPAAFQRARLEWLYRLLREPRRLRRQLALPLFVLAAWRDAGSQRTAHTR